jgi:transcriptional regulator with XRE-family HTH domain
MTQADLVRASGISRGGVSNLINQVRDPDPKSCKAIAKALNLPVELVFRKAGLLPPEPLYTEYEKEVAHLIREMSPEDQYDVLEYIRFKVERGKQNIKTSRKHPARTALIEQ